MMTKQIKRMLSLLITFLIFMATTTSAHPPTGMKLDYNQTTGTLHIEMRHVTGNMRKHYIRRILVYKNQEEPISLAIPQQTTPSSMVKDVPLKANPKDVIRVQAFSTDGGSAEETLIIPESVTPIK